MALSLKRHTNVFTIRTINKATFYRWDTYNTERHSRHADLQVTGRGGVGGLRGRLAEPALDGEDDGCPADHLVAGEDLWEKEEVRVSWIDWEAGA